jgi:hypothetical protein
VGGGGGGGGGGVQMAGALYISVTSDLGGSGRVELLAARLLNLENFNDTNF